MRERKVYRVMAKPTPVDLFDPISEKSLLDFAHKLGFEAFMACRHYCENPFHQKDWQRSDAWDEGWAAAENANPGKFDHTKDRFNFTLPYIHGNPSCPF